MLQVVIRGGQEVVRGKGSLVGGHGSNIIDWKLKCSHIRDMFLYWPLYLSITYPLMTPNTFILVENQSLYEVILSQQLCCINLSLWKSGTMMEQQSNQIIIALSFHYKKTRNMLLMKFSLCVKPKFDYRLKSIV